MHIPLYQSQRSGYISFLYDSDRFVIGLLQCMYRCMKTKGQGISPSYLILIALLKVCYNAYNVISEPKVRVYRLPICF